MKIPHFLVVGAARAGTTSLQQYLRQHPGLFLPKLKEPCFFTFADDRKSYKQGKFAFVVRDWDKYMELFEEAAPQQVRGEISTPYLYLYNQTIANIRKFHPVPGSLKILILLRDPAERAFSQYMWRVRDGRESLSFEEAIEKEESRREEGFSFDYFYVDRGLYSRQVEAYMEAFTFVKVMLLEDLKEKPEESLAQICNFLGVDEHFVFSKEEELNASYEPRWKALSRLITMESKTKFRILNQLPESWRHSIRQQFQDWNSKRTASMKLNPATRKRLVDFYTPDILKLQGLIHRDLAAWMKA